MTIVNSTKPQLKQVSNYLGVLVGTVGNLLPYLTPDFIAGLGLSASATHIVSSVVALLLLAYQEKQKAPAIAVDLTPPPPAAPKQGGFITRNFATFLAALALGGAVAWSMSGCAYMSQLIAPAAQPFVLAAVDVAVAQAISKQAGNDVAAQKVVAAKVKSVAQQVLAADASVTTTVATLEIDLNAKIVALKLPPPELAAGLALAASLEAALTTYIQTTPKGQVVASTQLAIADVCNAVITAAGAYGV